MLENARIRVRVGVVFALLAAGASLSGDTNTGPSTLPGVVVEAVGKGFAGEKAGIRAGDLLLSWERAAAPPANPQAAGGEILSPFDLDAVESEQSPRGAVTLSGEREGKPFKAALPPGRWEVTAAPWFEADNLALYRQGSQAIQRKETEAGIASWKKVAEMLEVRGGQLPACWLRVKIGDTLAAARQGGAAQSAYELAVASAKTLGRSDVEARVWTARGRAYQRENNRLKAEEAFREALRVREKRSGESLETAARLTEVGAVLWKGENTDEAGECFTKALAIAEKLAPGSFRLAIYLNNFGMVAFRRGDLARAEQCHQRALAILEKTVPDGLEAANTFFFLGAVATSRDQLAMAEAYYRKTVSLMETLIPGSLVLAQALNNLGIVVRDRGDLAAAEQCHKKALAIRRKLAPGGQDEATSLNNLGVVALACGDLEAAQDYFRRTLEVIEKLAPGSLRVAVCQNNLGTVASSFGNFAAAGEWHRKALAIQETLAPGGSDVAYSLLDLGRVAMGQGDVPGAEAYFRKALAIRENLMPESLGVAFSLSQLGDAALSRGDLVTAEDCYRRALGIREKLVPGSGSEANSLFALAGLYKAKGDLTSALSFYRRSVAALEARKGKLGGNRETMERYAAQHADYYRDLVELLARLKMTEEAFDTLERFRARSLLDMLAERDLEFARDAPAEMIAEQKRTDIDYDRVQKRLGEISPGREPDEVRELLTRLRELNKKREEIRESMKQASPRLASLQDPKPLNLAGVRKVLAPGTLFISYCVGLNSTQLFTLLDGSLSCYTLPIRGVELTGAVKFYLKFLAALDNGEDRISRKSRQLYDTLLKPAANEIRRAKRLLICPDDILHLLPFAALKNDRDSYLVEEKPLSCTLSASVYAETRKPRGTEKRPTRLVAFGDPVYTGGTAGDPAGNRMPGTTGAADLAPLPSSRAEVERIGALFPGAKLLLGPEAREETAKKLDKGTSLIHFACHGVLDERFHLNSGLALSTPERIEEGRDNGVLQSWEILEQIRVDADLVTLSACETGLGKEMGGEGMVGLTRAFQYAGAHAVLSTLWSVADESTADFMARFYGWLKKGRSPSDALRRTQLSFLRDPTGKWSHPFHWAPFVLNGE